MSADSTSPRETAGGARELSGRLFGAVEVLVSTHAERAQREASDDARRVISGVALVVIAALLLLPVVMLADVAIAVTLVEQGELGLAPALASVAFANLIVAVLATAAGRTRLRAPVLKETRATLRKAAEVLRG